MKVTLLCTDPAHPVNSYLCRWADELAHQHDIQLVRSSRDLKGGDILFLVSCSELVKAEDRRLYKTTLVLHASDLPRGRGWSPHVWEVIAGGREITVSILEAAERIDSGRIWGKVKVQIPDHALWYEINNLIFRAETDLMSRVVADFDSIVPVEQDPMVEPTYYRRRTAEDSRIDPDISIAKQFDLLRVCDPERFPAFFDLNGHRYVIKIEKCSGG